MNPETFWIVLLFYWFLIFLLLWFVGWRRILTLQKLPSKEIRKGIQLNFSLVIFFELESSLCCQQPVVINSFRIHKDIEGLDRSQKCIPFTGNSTRTKSGRVPRFKNELIVFTYYLKLFCWIYFSIMYFFFILINKIKKIEFRTE